MKPNVLQFKQFGKPERVELPDWLAAALGWRSGVGRARGRAGMTRGGLCGEHRDRGNSAFPIACLEPNSASI